jgi:hypothetical protein
LTSFSGLTAGVIGSEKQSLVTQETFETVMKLVGEDEGVGFREEDRTSIVRHARLGVRLCVLRTQPGGRDNQRSDRAPLYGLGRPTIDHW